MARNFNTNQNRHVYVADSYVEDSKTLETTNGHPITLKETAGKGGINDKAVYFLYKGADTVIKSELIQVKNIDYIRGFKAADLRTPFKSQTVTLDTDVNGGEPVVGQDYILRIVLRQWIGMSDEDVYYKEAAVHVISGMDKTAFYTKMKEQLDLVFSREIGANKDSNPYLKFEASADGITITEKAQPYHRGLEQQLPVLFEAEPSTIFIDGTDVKWGKVENKTKKKSEVTIEGDDATGRGNGTDIADLEYFTAGERGDQYRMVGWPNIIPTEYLVDPTKEYNVLEIHHAFTDTGINSYRSDKDITIVSTDEGTITSIINALKEKTGLDIPGLDDDSSASSSTSGN